MARTRSAARRFRGGDGAEGSRTAAAKGIKIPVLDLTDSDEESPTKPTKRPRRDGERRKQCKTDGPDIMLVKEQDAEEVEGTGRKLGRGKNKRNSDSEEDEPEAKRWKPGPNRKIGAKTRDGRIILASSPGRITSLKPLMSEAQKLAIHKIGFGGLLEMSLPDTPTGMAEWLIAAFDERTMTVRRGNTKLFHITPEDVRETFGLPLCPNRPVEDGVDNWTTGIRHQWGEKYHLITRGSARPRIPELRSRMLGLKNGCDDFIRMFVLYAVTTFLSPVAGGTVDFRPLRSTKKIEDIKKQDWCSYVIQKLVAATQRFKGDQKQQSFSGCYLLLMLTYFRKVHCIGFPPTVDRPFVKGCTYEQILKRIRFEQRCGGFGKSHLVGPQDEELNNSGNHNPNANTLETIPNPLSDDRQIEALLPNVYHQNIAKLIRDVEAVVEKRLQNVSDVELMADSEKLPVAFIAAGPRVVKTVDRSIRILTRCRDFIEDQVSNLNEEEEEDSDEGEDSDEEEEDSDEEEEDSDEEEEDPDTPPNKGARQNREERQNQPTQEALTAGHNEQTEDNPQPENTFIQEQSFVHQEVTGEAIQSGMEHDALRRGKMKSTMYAAGEIEADGLKQPVPEKSTESKLGEEGAKKRESDGPSMVTVAPENVSLFVARLDAAISEDLPKPTPPGSIPNECAGGGQEEALSLQVSQPANLFIQRMLAAAEIEPAQDTCSRGHSTVAHSISQATSALLKPKAESRTFELQSLSGEGSSWTGWPSNPANVYNSKVVHRLSAEDDCSLPACKLEVADFCISGTHMEESRKLLPYNDGVIVLEWQDFKGLEMKDIPAPVLIGAWSRLLNAQPSHVFPGSHICLNIVPSYKWGADNGNLSENWNSGMNGCNRSITTAELVFVPICFTGHYALMLVNFRTKEIQFLDSHVHKRMDKWRGAAFQIREELAAWLHNCGHKQGLEVSGFEVIHVGGEWRGGSKKPNAGIYVMYLMRYYAGDKAWLPSTPIVQMGVAVMEALRVCFCCDLVLSCENLSKSKILALTPMNITSKLFAHFQASLAAM